MKNFLLAVLLIGGALVLKTKLTNKTPNIQSPEHASVSTTTDAREVVGIKILPEKIEQGDPAEIMITGTTSVKSLTFNNKPLDTFLINGRPSALLGIDLKMANGVYPVKVTLSDGRVLTKDLLVGKRKIATAPLGIPEKLGGNTPEGEKTLLNSLARDNATLASIPTTKEVLWSGAFNYPVKNPEVTDVYGYTRLTVSSTISHKGTDFHAPAGTPVMAMNSGIVRSTQFFTAYGNTVVIDHGFGLETMYMHLSEISVKVGEKVKKGEVIGKSGETGYSEGPHLHISVRIGGVSIDPQKFLSLLQ